MGRNNLKMMNAFSASAKIGKWAWKSPNRITKSEINFILSDRSDIVPNFEVLGKIKSSSHRMMRSEIRLHLNRERMKKAKNGRPSLLSVRDKAQEFRITNQKMLSFLSRANEESIDVLHDSDCRVSNIL